MAGAAAKCLGLWGQITSAEIGCSRASSVVTAQNSRLNPPAKQNVCAHLFTGFYEDRQHRRKAVHDDVIDHYSSDDDDVTQAQPIKRTRVSELRTVDRTPEASQLSSTLPSIEDVESQEISPRPRAVVQNVMVSDGIRFDQIDGLEVCRTGWR